MEREELTCLPIILMPSLFLDLHLLGLEFTHNVLPKLSDPIHEPDHDRRTCILIRMDGMGL